MNRSTTNSNLPKSPTPPDGGWGWVVTFSSFMISILVDGINLTFGVFFAEYLSYFDESKGRTQMIQSVLVGTMFITGPLAGSLVNRFGTRKVTISGSIIFSVGVFLSTFSPNLDVMILLHGVVAGFGFGLMYIPSLVIVGIYFDKHRALATGIAMCGSGIGSFAFAPLYEVLLRIYGWKGVLWIMSAVTLNGTVFASMFRPLGKPNKTSGRLESSHYSDNEYQKSNSDSFNNCCSSVRDVLTDLFDVSLLSRPVLVVCAMSSFLFMLGIYVPFNFLPVLATGLHLSTSESSLLISVIGISNTVTRVLVGYVSDKTWADSILINNIALIAGGVATIFVPFYGEFGTLAAYSTVFGASMAVFMTLRTIIMADLLGIEKLSKSFGLMSLCMGISSIAGSPIAGTLVDWKGDYDVAFYFAGITMGLAGVIGLPLRRIAKWEQSRHVDIKDYKVQEQDTNITLAYINPLPVS